MNLSQSLSLTPSLPHSLTPSLPHSLTPSLTHSLTPSLPHSLTPPLPHSLTPSLPHSLTPSLPPHSLTPSLSLPHSLTPSLPHSLTPSLPHSLTPLPHSLTPPLPHSLTLTPSLPHSLPHSLNPSIPHSPTPSLPHSLTPSLPHSLTPPLPHSPTPSLPQSKMLWKEYFDLPDPTPPPQPLHAVKEMLIYRLSYQPLVNEWCVHNVYKSLLCYTFLVFSMTLPEMTPTYWLQMLLTDDMGNAFMNSTNSSSHQKASVLNLLKCNYFLLQNAVSPECKHVVVQLTMFCF